jgi:hypothetical protein
MLPKLEARRTKSETNGEIQKDKAQNYCADQVYVGAF